MSEGFEKFLNTNRTAATGMTRAVLFASEATGIIPAIARELQVETMLQIVFSTRQTPTLEIAWRNPNPINRHLRRHRFAGVRECAMYFQQEFVTEGDASYWATISKLEVVSGGRTA